MVMDFIKSLFLPSKMVRFRYMSVLFAIGIFILSSYALMVPAKVDIESSFNSMVAADNYLYLQAISEIPSNAQTKEIFAELNNKGLKNNSDTGALEATNMGCLSAELDSSLLGVLQLDEDGFWLYSGTETGIKNNLATNVNPTVIIENNKLKINGQDTNITIENISNDVEVIKISTTNKGYFKVNEELTSILSKKDYVSVSKNDEGYVVLNNITTTTKTEKENVVIYFVPNKAINYYENSLSYVNDEGITINVKIVIDLYQDETKKGLDVANYFRYSQEDETLVNRFPAIATTEYHLIVLGTQYVYYQANPTGVNDLQLERYGSTLSSAYSNSYYSSVELDSTMFTTVEEGVSNLFEIIKVGYIASYNSIYSIITFVYCVGFTLLFAFIFWLFFRKSGRLKTFKEYYNIAAIVAIPITIITFIVLWFYPDGIGNVYPFIFVVYYLFILYRINSLPEIV